MDGATARYNIRTPFILGEGELILHSGGCWCCNWVEGNWNHSWTQSRPDSAVTETYNHEGQFCDICKRSGFSSHKAILQTTKTLLLADTAGRSQRINVRWDWIHSLWEARWDFSSICNQMLVHLEASLKDRTEAALRPSYPWRNTNPNLFFWVAHLASLMSTEFTLT